MKIWSILVLLVIFMHASGLAQDHHFENYSQDDGLSNNFVHSIYQDSKGWMWFGTHQGLNRFDGYKFTTFREDNKEYQESLSIRSILEDKHGRIWIGSENNGLKIFDRKQEQFSNIALLAQGSISVSALQLAPNGTLWIGTQHGILAYNTHAQKQVQTSKLTNKHAVTLLQLDRQGILWAGTSTGINRIDTHTLAQLPDTLPAAIQKNDIRCIYFASDSEVWVGTYSDGIFIYNTKTESIRQLIPDSQNSRSQTVRSIVRDSKGQFWIGTRAGLYCYNPTTKSSTHYQHDQRLPNSLIHNSILNIYIDTKGDLWVATRSGISFLNHEKQIFERYKSLPDDTHFLNNNEVYCFWQAPNNDLWVGTESGGINILNRKTSEFTYLTTSSKPQGLSSNCIKTITSDAHGNIWIGTFLGGLNIYTPTTHKVQQYRHNPQQVGSLSNDEVWCIFRSKSNQMWVGTERGLNLWNAQTQQFEQAQFLPKNSKVAWIKQDSQGRLWFGLPSKLIIWNENTHQLLSHNIHARSMLETKDGRFWLTTTYRGLALFDTNKGALQYFDEHQGIANNLSLELCEDAQGTIWISTANGLTRFFPESQRMRNYSRNDGLQNNQFLYGSSLKLRSGELVFGGIDGFNIFDPSALPKEKFRPPVVLTELRIFNHAVAISDKAESILHQSISETNELIVPYEKNVLTFEFAALDYALSKQNQYAYQLENFEAKPNIAGKQRTATYTNLDPGTYYFCVKTATPDGVWNPNGIRLKVQILPPYWKTLWFKLLFILLILIVIAILLRVLFKRGELKNALNLEREKARQLHEIDMMKLHFFTNISHEIRTPLTLIIAPLEKLLREKLSPDEQHEHFRLMHRNASQLMRLINQLLDFRKIENGKLKLEISRGDIVAFSRNTFESFADLAHEKAISLHFNAIENEIFTGFDADKYEKILNNLLSNALKYTTKDGSITLNISLALKQNDAETQALAYQKIIEISVIDTGQGISRNDLPKLFTRFLQLGTQKKANSTGIGLSLTKELVELHQGHIYVESEEGKGSRFCVQLPYYPEYKDQSPNDLYNNQTPNENTKPNTTEEEQSQENILLIVEDNTDVRNFLKQQFETQFAIVESTNGQHGLQKALQLIPDLIISDVMMPGLDGFELCRQLKKDERSSHIPLILLSALGTQEHRLEGLQAGADDYITKPFDPSLLQARVDNLLTNRTALREKFSGEMILRPKNITISSPDERFLQKAIEVIEQHITDPDLDIERFAQAVGVSRMQLYRKLKALTDMTVKEFERDIRLERAAQMLQTKGLNISEIAYGVGFKDLSYFRKCFRTKFGKNAREYAEQFNTENKPESH